jgi:hypothetical protein
MTFILLDKPLPLAHPQPTTILFEKGFPCGDFYGKTTSNYKISSYSGIFFTSNQDL